MAKYTCPQCGYKTQVAANMEKHIRDLRHDGVKRKISKVGQPQQQKKK